MCLHVNKRAVAGKTVSEEQENKTCWGRAFSGGLLAGAPALRLPHPQPLLQPGPSSLHDCRKSYSSSLSQIRQNHGNLGKHCISRMFSNSLILLFSRQISLNTLHTPGRVLDPKFTPKEPALWENRCPPTSHILPAWLLPAFPDSSC